MSNRNFNRKQALEREIKDLYLLTQYNALIQATGTLATTTPIVLTKVAGGAANNTDTFTVVVNAAAANPTDTVLVAFTGTAAAIVVTVTPNDGTNNSATPVDLTTAELVELINSGAVVGKTVTVTDASALRNDQTATGGGAANLAHSGEGDGAVATFAGGQDQSFTNSSRLGISSIAETGTGTFRVVLEDKYNVLKFAKVIVQDATARNLVAQIAASDVNGTTPSIDFIVHANGVAANPADGSKLRIGFELKNTDII